MYRAVAWCALRLNVPLSDGLALAKLAQEDLYRAALAQVENGIGETDPEHMLRSPEVDAASSQVAQFSEVRQALVQQQQEIASQGSIVMVGRDIGTKVAPDADLKVYLVASPETRARRRLLQDENDEPFSQILAQMEERDRRDTQRSDSPLSPADDAFLLDTEHLNPQQAVDGIIARLEIA